MASLVIVVGPLGFERTPQWRCIATSADFYAIILSFFEVV
jgi:hypothetical protein